MEIAPINATQFVGLGIGEVFRIEGNSALFYKLETLPSGHNAVYLVSGVLTQILYTAEVSPVKGQFVERL